MLSMLKSAIDPNARVPILCDMVKVNQVMTHMDRNKSYFLVLKARHGLVAIFGHTPLSDTWWGGADQNLNQSDNELYITQRRKTQNPLVMEELLKIRDLAKRHSIPKEAILLVEESSCNVEDTASRVRQMFGTGGTVHDVSATLPLLSNRVGQALTHILVDEMWIAASENAKGQDV